MRVGRLERRRPGKATSDKDMAQKWIDQTGRARCKGGADLEATQRHTVEFRQEAAAFVNFRDELSLRGELHAYEANDLDNVDPVSETEA